MALGALYEGHGESALPYLQGKIMAQELCSLGLNLNFAPVVDVNSNQANPVINVRAFGDCPAQVDRLARQMVKGSAQIVTCYKHFPGHGDTHTDSHLNLPRVDRNREQAYAVDLAPYIAAIADNDAPDMIMTAHIQYPALDDSLITRLDGEDIIVPATLSRRIQHHMLRQEMGYRGVTITDALDMKAISDHFDPRDVVKRVFNAGVDIALMPVSVQAADEEDKLRELIDYIVAQVERGEIDSEEIDVSVARILTLKRAKTSLRARRLPPRSARPSGAWRKRWKALLPINRLRYCKIISCCRCGTSAAGSPFSRPGANRAMPCGRCCNKRAFMTSAAIKSTRSPGRHSVRKSIAAIS
ncbi:Beta-hexosaminidase [Sodalis praecaptivus]